MIEHDLDRIDLLFGFGVRALGITYSESNALGNGLKEKSDGGLTAFGRKAVERMNKVGMLIDCSHCGDQTTLDTIECSEKPILLSHIGARALWDSNRLAPDEVLVTPDAEVGSVPSWIGEQIPVPYEVALEVGEVRRGFESTGEVAASYPLGTRARQEIRQTLADHGATAPLPTDRRVTVEPAVGGQGVRLVIVQGTFGSHVNAALGWLLAALLESARGGTVGVRTDPYRILLEVPPGIRPHDVALRLRGLDAGSLEPTLRIVLRNSHRMHAELLHTARKLGVLRKDIDARTIDLDRLVLQYQHTPLLEEALQRTIDLRLDLPHATEVVAAIAAGRIRCDGQLAVLARLAALLGSDPAAL